MGSILTCEFFTRVCQIKRETKSSWESIFGTSSN